MMSEVKRVRDLCRTVEQYSVGHISEDFRTNLGVLFASCQRLRTGPCQDMEEATSLARCLLQLLCKDLLPRDTMMLASATLCALLLATEHSALVSQVLADCLAITVSLPKLSLKHGFLQLELEVVHPECFKTTICHGILHLKACSGLSAVMLSVDGSKPSVARAVFQHLQKHCNSYSRFTCCAFRLLSLWLQKVGEVSQLEKDIISSVFSIVNSNWENPLNGVRAQNTRLLRTLLDVCGNYDGCCLDGPQQTPLTVAALFHEVMFKQPWHVRSKYFVLEVVLPKYGVQKGLNEFGCLADGLFWSLSQPSMASAGTLVYRVCLSGITLQDWLRHFLEPAVRVMTADPRTVSVQEQNFFSYWIQPTLKVLPSLLSELVMCLAADTDFVNNPAALFAVVSLLRAGQKESVALGPAELGHVDVVRLLDVGLQHRDPAVRGESFGLLCSSLGTPLLCDIAAFDMLASFLVDNASTDDTQMRQCVINSFISFLLRVRDCCVRELKQVPASIDLKVPVDKTLADKWHLSQVTLSECFPNTKGEGILTLTTYFFQWLHGFIMSNLETGSKYQRKVLSLQLLKSVLLYIVRPECMVQKRGAFQQKKCKTRDNSSARLHVFIEKNNSWLFSSSQTKACLLRCILDQTDDIREAAAGMLTQFFNLSEEDEELERGLFKTAMNLCKSSKFYVVESGAVLVQVLGAWFGTEHRDRETRLVSHFLELDYSEWCKLVRCQTVEDNGPEECFEPGREGLSQDVSVADLSGSHRLAGMSRTLVGLLVSCVEVQGYHLRRDVATAAMRGSPLHGLLVALTLLLAQPSRVPSITEVHQLLSLVESTVEHLLRALSGRPNTCVGTSPSFAEMMKAVEDHLSAVDQYEDCLHISAAHQTVLSCIWLNLKACCELARTLAGMGEGLSERCWRVVTNVLMRCRHKGAIEAAGQALQRLVAEASLRGETLGEDALNEVLRADAASVTRRSAGLGILIHCMASGDQLPDKRLLQCWVFELQKTAASEVDDSPELLDCSQGRALHLLRPLVQDASLWPHLVPHATSLTHLCLRHLSCPRWPVRNAALLLFGALVSKIVGKMGMSVEEFLNHYPEMADMLLRELRMDAAASKTACLGIIPALSLLCKLSLSVDSLADTRTNAMVAELRPCLAKLLADCNYKVRQLSAKAYACMVPHSQLLVTLESILGSLGKQSSCGKHHLTQNGIHGHLMLVRCLTERFIEGSEAMPSKNILMLNLNFILDLGGIADFSKALLLEFHKEIHKRIVYESKGSILKVIALKEQCLHENDSPLVKEKFEELIFLTTSPDALQALCSEKLGGRGCWSQFSTLSLAALKHRLANDTSITRACKTDILCALLSAVAKIAQMPMGSHASHLLEAVFIVLSGNDIDHLHASQDESFLSLITMLESGEYEYFYEGYPIATAVAAGLVSTQLTNDSRPGTAARLLRVILRLIEEASRPCSKHEEYRFYAAVAMQILVPSAIRFAGPNNTVLGKALLGSALALLQDECSTVRNEAAAFVVKFRPDHFGIRMVNPYHCLRKLLDADYFKEFISLQEAFQYFFNMFSCSEDLDNVIRTLDSQNHISPYDHGVSNVYGQDFKVLELIFSSVMNLLVADTFTAEVQQFKQTITVDRIVSLKMHIDSIHNLLDKSGTNTAELSDCYATLHIILKKLSYQLLTMKHLLEATEESSQEMTKELAVCCELMDGLWKLLESAVIPALL